VVRVEAAPEDVGMSTARLRNVTRLVRDYVAHQKYPGLITLVARRGKVVHLDVCGAADVARARPMRPDSIFRIYSMTKPVASVALMTLYEEGRCQLDDPVSRFIPAWRDLTVLDGGQLRLPEREMTVRDLLTHMSGLVGHHDRGPIGQLYRDAGIHGPETTEGTLADLVRKLRDIPLCADPGARWSYGISTDVVGHLCELISGQPFDRFLAERIFNPLGMTDTGFTVPPGRLDRFTACYGRRDGTPRYQLLDDPTSSMFAGPRSYLSGSAGLVSTAGDYLRFCRMLARGGELDGVRILGPRTLRFMTANHLPGGRDLTAFAANGGETSREGQGFGLGFGVLLDQTVAQVVASPGEIFWGGAASTAFFVSPADDLVVIFLTQLRPSSTYPIRRELRATVYSSIVD
jgi:CubicO group peptidase (beta-lactamase class C family)